MRPPVAGLLEFWCDGQLRLRSNLALLLTRPSKITALFAALTGHNLLKGPAAALERYVA